MTQATPLELETFSDPVTPMRVSHSVRTAVIQHGHGVLDIVATSRRIALAHSCPSDVLIRQALLHVGMRARIPMLI